MVKYLLIFASCMNCSRENNTGDSNKRKNKNNDPQSQKIKNNIGKILNNHSSLKSIIENWCRQNNATLDEVLTFIKDDQQLNIFEYFPNNSKYVKDNKALFDIDKKIKDDKIQDKGLLEDLKYALELMSKNIEKHGNKIDIYDGGTQKVIKEFSNESDIYFINTNYRLYIRDYNNDQNERKKFDEYIKKIREEKEKYKLDENIIKILVGNTKYDMDRIDFCGCELHYILYEIKSSLESYKSKNKQYDEKRLNELVAIYNNNIGNFSQEVMKLRDGFVDELTKDYAYSDEFKKIVKGSSDYGKNISKEDLKKIEDEFFSLDKKLSLDEDLKKINYNFIHSYYRLYVRSDSSNQDKIRKFDEKVEELKKNNGLDENTVKILIGTTNRKMTAIDRRTCGCELYYILNEIKLSLESYKSKNDQYYEKELNELVAIYNNNIGNFSPEVMKLKDGFVDELTKDYAYSDEFKKIVNGSSDYGKNISKEDLKKIEDDFFNFNSQKK